MTDLSSPHQKGLDAQTHNRPARRSKPSGVNLVVLALLGLGLVALAVWFYASKQTPKGTVVYARQDIPTGSIIQIESLEERQLDTNKIPKDALTSAQTAVGDYSRGMLSAKPQPLTGIRKGQLITWRYVTTADGVPVNITPSVVYATKDIAAGYYIAKDAVEQKAMEVEKIPSTIYELDAKTAADSFARKAIKKGEMISRGLLGPDFRALTVFYAIKDIPAGTVIRKDALRIEEIKPGNDDAVRLAELMSKHWKVQWKSNTDIKEGQMIRWNDVAME